MMGRTILGGLKILSVGSKTFTRFWKKTFQDFFDLFSASWSVIVQLGLKLNTKLGLDHHHPPTTTNFSKGSRLGRRLRFYM